MPSRTNPARAATASLGALSATVSSSTRDDPWVSAQSLSARAAAVAAQQPRSMPRSVSQRWNAARCLVRDLPLATLNVKNFAAFAQHEGLELVS